MDWKAWLGDLRGMVISVFFIAGRWRCRYIWKAIGHDCMVVKHCILYSTSFGTSDVTI